MTTTDISPLISKSSEPYHTQSISRPSCNVILAAIGIILIIGSAAAAGLLYSSLGYASLACLVPLPIGVALVWNSCRQKNQSPPQPVITAQLATDTTIPWDTRLLDYLINYLLQAPFKSCVVLTDIAVISGIRPVQPNNFILKKDDYRSRMEMIVQDLKTLIQFSNYIKLAWVFLAKNGYLFDCHILTCEIHNQNIKLEKALLDEAPLDRVTEYLNNMGIQRTIKRLQTDLDQM